jgi:2,4-dichlorophenol 6-monooxygenase
VLKASRWHLESITATQYQTKHIFLAGDAVHRHPSTIGLGLNTAIGDAYNITWKLAAVLNVVND